MKYRKSLKRSHMLTYRVKKVFWNERYTLFKQKVILETLKRMKIF